MRVSARNLSVATSRSSSRTSLARRRARSRRHLLLAPVIISREHLSDGGTGAPSYGTARAVVVNSGIANAATGVPGLEHAREMARITADAVGCTDEEVLVASTGVIGQHLPLDPFKTGVPQALAEANREGGGLSCARDHDHRHAPEGIRSQLFRR